MKRKQSETLKVIEKKQKAGIVPSSPLDIGDLLLNIASNLKGEDLKHFKMVNHFFYSTAKELDCSLNIGIANFMDVCSLRGHHYIPLAEIYNSGDRNDVLLDQEIERLTEKGITFPNVEYLTIDHGQKNCFIDEKCIYLFPELKELRIIRAVSQINLDITETKLPKLRKLIIYTKTYVRLIMNRDLDVCLYSQLHSKESFDIHKLNKIDDKRIKAYGGGFTYTYPDCYRINCEMMAFYDFKMAHPKSRITYQTFNYPIVYMPQESLSRTYKQFVPNPKFMP